MEFREYTTKAGTLVLAGKNARNNEELIQQIKSFEEVFHTAAPGSPFTNIKGKPKKGDIKEAAMFCARYSHDWRDNKDDVEVHRFKGKDVFKIKTMKLGTFGVKNLKKIKVKREDIIKFIKNS